MPSSLDVTSVSTARADCPSKEKETCTTGSLRVGFNFTESLGIKNKPKLIKQIKTTIIEKEGNFTGKYFLVD
jgi:hypothetical protein